MKFINIIALTILGIAAIAAYYLIAQKSLKNSAIDGCLKTASIQIVDGKQTVETPENYWYTLCLKEKGYK